MPPPAPQSAAELPSHARYGVRAVAAGNDSQKTHGEAMYTATDCAARAALQAPVPQCKPFSGGSKGGVLVCEREHPLCPVQRQRRCHLPRPWQGKRKSTTTFVVMLYGAGDEARSRHYRAATRTAGDKRPTGAFSRFARALFDPLPARLELASRHPANRLTAIRRNPASPLI